MKPYSHNVSLPLALSGIPSASTSGDFLTIAYAELRRLATRHFRSERPDHTLQPTALVHEVYLRLPPSSVLAGMDRTQFFAVASQLMRQILIDHARQKQAQKRGGGVTHVPLEETFVCSVERPEELLALDEALRQLEAVAPRPARIIELRYFAGLSMEEIAHVLDRSCTTVKTDWQFAIAWLRRALENEA